MAGQFIASVLNWASRKWDNEATSFGTEADQLRKHLYLEAWRSYVTDFIQGEINLATYAFIHRLQNQDPEDFLLLMHWLDLY
jgi:hypothetical protein